MVIECVVGGWQALIWRYVCRIAGLAFEMIRPKESKRALVECEKLMPLSSVVIWLRLVMS